MQAKGMRTRSLVVSEPAFLSANASQFASHRDLSGPGGFCVESSSGGLHGLAFGAGVQNFGSNSHSTQEFGVRWPLLGTTVIAVT